MSRFHPQGCWPVLVIFVDPGTMESTVGPLVSAATATAAKNVKVSTPVSTVPFRPHSPIVSTRGQLPCHGVNASSISMVARSFQPTLRKNFVHNVDIPGSVQFSNVLFPVLVNVVMSTQDVCDKLPVTSAQASCPNFSSFIDCLQQDLVSPSRVTPINVEKLQCELYFHPDQTQVNYVISGLSNGFHLGFNPLAVLLKSASQNMPSASLQPSVIDQHLRTELEKGRVAGPFSIAPISNLHISCFGIIPKKYQPGKWQLILDLSSPVGHSVNNGIPKESFSVQYIKVDDVINGIMSLGRGSAKFDVESAYCMSQYIPMIVTC